MSKEKRRVPKLRFPGFTEDWEQRKLSEVTTCFDNLRVAVTASDRVPGKIPYYGANGIQDYVSGHTHSGEFVLIAEDGANDLNDYPIQYVNGAIWVNNHAHVIAGYKEKLENNFLSYSLKTVKMTTFIVGGGRSKLNLKALLEIPISMPNYDEQCVIGEFIETIDKNITLHQRKLNNLKLKKKALFQKLFPKNGERYPELRFPGFTDPWEQRKFKDIAFKRGKISEADLPYVEFEDINSGIGTLNKNISQKVGHKKGLLFEAGDVLFGKLRPYLQNWLLCQFAGIAVGDFWVLQPQNVSSAFLYYLIQSEAYQSVANISSGTKMPRSSWPLVSETLFSIPKYKEANMIGEFFLLIDRTITLHQRKLDHLQLQKKALLQQMFV